MINNTPTLNGVQLSGGTKLTSYDIGVRETSVDKVDEIINSVWKLEKLHHEFSAIMLKIYQKIYTIKFYRMYHEIKMIYRYFSQVYVVMNILFMYQTLEHRIR